VVVEEKEDEDEEVVVVVLLLVVWEGGRESRVDGLVVVVVSRSGEIQVSFVYIPREREAAATLSLVERRFSGLQSSI